MLPPPAPTGVLGLAAVPGVVSGAIQVRGPCELAGTCKAYSAEYLQAPPPAPFCEI